MLEGEVILRSDVMTEIEDFQLLAKVLVGARSHEGLQRKIVF